MGDLVPAAKGDFGLRFPSRTAALYSSSWWQLETIHGATTGIIFAARVRWEEPRKFLRPPALSICATDVSGISTRRCGQSSRAATNATTEPLNRCRQSPHQPQA